MVGDFPGFQFTFVFFPNAKQFSVHLWMIRVSVNFACNHFLIIWRMYKLFPFTPRGGGGTFKRWPFSGLRPKIPGACPCRRNYWIHSGLGQGLQPFPVQIEVRGQGSGVKITTVLVVFPVVFVPFLGGVSMFF